MTRTRLLGGAAALLALALAAASAERGGAVVISVPGVPGPYCMYGVEKRLLELEGVRRVELSWEAEVIRALLAPGEALAVGQVRHAIERADYPYDYTIETR